MEEKTKFKIRTFLYYLLAEPWTEKISLPNFSSLVWISILISAMSKNVILLWISIFIGIIFYMIKEYKSGKFIHWYRIYKKQKISKEKEENLKELGVLPRT